MLCILVLIPVLQACKPNDNTIYTLNVYEFNINITNNLRGLSVVNSKIIWASGTNGVFLKTTDGGNFWSIDCIKDAEKLDFISIEAFDENNAIVVSAGTPASI